MSSTLYDESLNCPRASILAKLPAAAGTLKSAFSLNKVLALSDEYNTLALGATASSILNNESSNCPKASILAKFPAAAGILRSAFSLNKVLALLDEYKTLALGATASSILNNESSNCPKASILAKLPAVAGTLRSAFSLNKVLALLDEYRTLALGATASSILNNESSNCPKASILAKLPAAAGILRSAFSLNKVPVLAEEYSTFILGAAASLQITVASTY